MNVPCLFFTGHVDGWEMRCHMALCTRIVRAAVFATLLGKITGLACEFGFGSVSGRISSPFLRLNLRFITIRYFNLDGSSRGLQNAKMFLRSGATQ